LTDAIALLSAQDLLNGCEINGDKSFCALVDRDPASGQITRIHNVFINIAKQRISGIDLEASYRTDLTMLGGGAERLSMRLFGTYLHENSLQNPGAAKDDRAGDDFPRYKATANLTYANGPVSLFLQERYIDGTVLDRTLTQSNVRIPGVATIDDNSVPSVWYTDLRLTYTLGESDLWQIYGSVTNLFNQEPPATPGAVGRGGTSEFSNGLYDTIGRRFVLGARFNY
jgi:outer membrane receptor protein involved in Fe transport